MNQTYTVQPGDTLYGISNQFGVSVSELSSLNNITNNILYIGQVLQIPIFQSINPTDMFTYTVVKGDSLYKLSNKYNVSVDELKKINNLKSDLLSVGQVLLIPQNYISTDIIAVPDFINYTVKKGDSLYSISIANNISIEQIKKDNNLTNNNLQVGQILKIRIEKEEIEECFGEDYNIDTYETYTVKKGDSLYSIANKYNTSVSNIKNLNNLTSNTLSIGQILKIPNSSITSTYVVQKGDSLYSIARKFNTSVDSIKRKNNLSSNLLSVGQKLII